MHLDSKTHSAFWERMRAQGVRVLTRDGAVANTKDQTMLLGPDYDDLLKPLFAFNNTDATLDVLGAWQLNKHGVSAAYLAADPDKQGWVRIFKLLGVVELIRVIPWTGKAVEAVDHA